MDKKFMSIGFEYEVVGMDFFFKSEYKHEYKQ